MNVIIIIIIIIIYNWAFIKTKLEGQINIFFLNFRLFFFLISMLLMKINKQMSPRRSSNFQGGRHSFMN